MLLRPTTTGALLTVVAMADAGSDPGLLPPAIADVVVLPVTTLVATNNGEVAFSGKDFGSRSTGLDWPTPDFAQICTICFKSEFRSDMMNACTGKYRFFATWRRLNSPRRLASFAECDWSS